MKTVSECRREIAILAVALHPVNENFCGLLYFPSAQFPPSLDITFPPKRLTVGRRGGLKNLKSQTEMRRLGVAEPQKQGRRVGEVSWWGRRRNTVTVLHRVHSPAPCGFPKATATVD
ncbi:hypothetical protein EVAR_13440_1 [Eumeta japonica]|uniref:Uncharacterized protein n=1 Tax=Eumeta variegata TaxID=151549 RepID=A0A4C1V669_EUMVA|nr:hypothetical protein EVAR_13440_1 [Eumeta japonica]